MDGKIKLENEDGTVTVIDSFTLTAISINENDFTKLTCEGQVTAWHTETKDGKVIQRKDDIEVN